MSKKPKTHWRKVFTSDHLSSADIEQMQEECKSLIFTIREVKAEFDTMVAGKKINANIAYFKENIKPMVLNAENGKAMIALTGSTWIEDWVNVSVELYVEKNIKFGREVVDGLRIKKQPPRILTEKDVNILKSKIIACVSVEDLTKLYNSDVKIKTNKVLLNALKERKQQLTQDSQ